jgi:hypothetical protein
MSDIPTVAVYRGVKVHAFQSEDRIRAVVCPEIDRALELGDPAELLAFVANLSHAPEARLAAAGRLLEWAGTAEQGRRRAPVTREQVEALTAGLGVLRWCDPQNYNSMLLVTKAGERPPTPRPPEYRCALLSASA